MDQSLALRHLHGMALLCIVDLIDDHKIDPVIFHKVFQTSFRVGLLKLFVIQYEVPVLGLAHLHGAQRFSNHLTVEKDLSNFDGNGSVMRSVCDCVAPAELLGQFRLLRCDTNGVTVRRMQFVRGSISRHRVSRPAPNKTPRSPDFATVGLKLGGSVIFRDTVSRFDSDKEYRLITDRFRATG